MNLFKSPVDKENEQLKQRIKDLETLNNKLFEEIKVLNETIEELTDGSKKPGAKTDGVQLQEEVLKLQCTNKMLASKVAALEIFEKENDEKERLIQEK